MVMVTFVLPVQQGVFSFAQQINGPSRTRQGDRLPQQPQRDEEDGCDTTHTIILSGPRPTIMLVA